MDGENTAGNQTSLDQMQTDPWAAAFAELEQKNKKDNQADTSNGLSDDSENMGDSNSEENNLNENSDDIAPNDSSENQDNIGGLDSSTGESEGIIEQAGEGSGSDFTEQDLEDYRQYIIDDIRDRVARQVNKEFIKQGVMSYNGVVGANINDERICKRDSDGVPHFYNPETGKEFTGDNPRQQAQDYCRSYNEELEQTFNRACAQVESKFASNEATELAVLEFAPTYDKMDAVRQKLFDDIVSDYEIKDSDGEIVGYECDLNKAAATVERMVASIQSFAPKEEESKETLNSDSQPGGPALDMPNRAAAVTTQPGMPKSIEEALVNYQDNLLNSRKK